MLYVPIVASNSFRMTRMTLFVLYFHSTYLHTCAKSAVLEYLYKAIVLQYTGCLNAAEFVLASESTDRIIVV